MENQSLQDPFSLYRTYIAIKSHFNSDFDFKKYGKIKSFPIQTFEKRKDRVFFYTLSKMLSKNITVDFFVSQVIERGDLNIVKIVEDPVQSQKIYTSWKERINSLNLIYREDIVAISKKIDYDWKNCFKRDNGDYPLLFKMVTQKEIRPETYTLLNDLFDHTSLLYKDLECDSIFLRTNFKYKKYRSFLNDYTKKQVLSMTPRNLDVYK